jgi:hypothetical protein
LPIIFSNKHSSYRAFYATAQFTGTLQICM